MVQSSTITRPLCSAVFVLLALACTQQSPSKEAQKTKAQSPAPQNEPSEKEQAKKPQTTNTLVVYSARSAGLVEPLFELFESKTGIKVKARFDKSTQTLANRIATEGPQTEADLFFAQDSGYLGALARADHLDTLPETINGRVPASYRDQSNKWVGTSGRARVLVYSPERVKPADLPKALEDLANPRWKGRVGWAPSNGSYQAHVSALRKLWGEERTRKWLNSMKAIGPKRYPKNSPQVRAVSNGEIDIGWVNHYYLHKLKAANPDLKAANYSFSAKGDAGNLMMISGIAITKHSKNKELAQSFIQFLLSDDAQRYFAEKVFEYPTVQGIKTSAQIPPIDTQMVTIDQEALSDVAGTIKLLREVGLQ